MCRILLSVSHEIRLICAELCKLSRSSEDSTEVGSVQGRGADAGAEVFGQGCRDGGALFCAAAAAAARRTAFDFDEKAIGKRYHKRNNKGDLEIRLLEGQVCA